MRKVLKWLDENFEKYISVLLMSVSTVVIFIQVIMRYVFKNSLVWSEELARYCFIWLIFIAASYGCKKRAQIKIEAALKLFPKKARSYVIIVGDLLVLILTGYLFCSGISLVRFQIVYHKVSPAIGLPMWVVYMAPVVGFGLIIIREIQVILAQVSALNQTDKNGKGEK